MKILYNTESLEKAEGGISAASRLFLKYLNSKKKNQNLAINLNCLRSYEDNHPFNTNLKFAQNSKFKFFMNNLRGLMKNNLIIYDHIDLAKAHLSFFNKNYLIFGYGVDMWEMSKKKVKIAENSKKIILCSHFTESKMNTNLNYNFKNTEVCWLSSYDDEYKKRVFRDDNKEINILILGRIDDDRKGHFLILDIWNDLKRKYKNIKLTMVGRSIIKDKIIKTIKDYQIQDSVSYLGYVKENDLQNIWNKTDIFFMPGTVEGFGFVYIEAMKNSVPIIASTHDSGNEINENEVSGFNIDQFDKKQLIQSLSILIENKELRMKFSENALNRFKKNFKYSDYEKRMDNIFLNFI